VASVRDVVNDPKFLQLPPDEQAKVLAHLDQNFAGLPPAEQTRVVNSLQRSANGGDWSGGVTVFHKPTVADRLKAAPGEFIEGVGASLRGMGNAFLHPIDTAKGMIQETADHLVNSEADDRLANQIETDKSRPVIDRMVDPERLRLKAHAAAEMIRAIPIAGPMADDITNEVTSDGGSVARAAGKLTGMELGGRATGALIDNVLPAALERTAPGQYMRTFAAKTRGSRAIAERVTPRLIREGETFSDPSQLAERADARIPSDGRIDAQAIADAPNGMPLQPLLASIEDAIRKHQSPFVDPETGVTRYIVKDPVNGPATIKQLEMYQDALMAHAVTDAATGEVVVSPEHVINLRRAWEDAPKNEGLYEDTAKVGSASARIAKQGADAIRGRINELPNVKALNEEASYWKDVKTIAQRAPQPKPILEGVPMKLGMSALAHVVPFGTPVTIGAFAAQMLNRARQSAWWRTTSAVNKVRLAGLIRAGHFGDAADFALRLSGAGNAEDATDAGAEN
jgi:hypothetical protein